MLKAPQKREIGNYGLSMHYEINTGVTTALLFGTDISVCGKDHNSPLTPSTSGSSTLPVFDEKTKSPWIRFPSEGTLTQFRRPELITMLESVLHSLRHPLLLPCLILEDHMRRTQNLCEHKQVFQETWQIMHKLGLRGDDRSQELFWIEAMAHTNAYSKQKADERFDAKLLTARMDRQVLRIMYTERSPQWNYKCSAFLLDFLNNLDVRQPSLDFDFVMNETLRDGLESNMSMAESLSSRLATMKESMMLQLEVLASIVSQSSNEWSANISWESARDSTSMKILALITAFFLPATFVATVFGMSMFDWMWADDPSGPSSGGGGGGGGGNSNNNNSNNTEPGVVSHRFWIYVAFAVPLTLFTLAGWIGWWAFEMHLRRQKEQNRQRRTLSRRIDEQFENLDQEVKGWKKRSGLRTATTAIKVEKDSKSLV